MTEKLQQTIKEMVDRLPKETQNAISTFNWAEIVEEIGKKYLLDEDEINDLGVETFLVLIGLADSALYAINIEDNVGTTKNDATKMATEVFEKIFVPISNIIEENIKKNLKSKDPNLQQSLDFILSGGDYSAFIRPTTTGNLETSTTPVKPPTLQDIKDNLVI